eukprot:TRINITY_DN27147_c0_g2_i1.p1 TRINITY_DN27147_c0_g2~~TRINITY_DN27147_c0_g2_i1.p1  ORF type:complete len:112 (-),score=28.09 TRINITY_DN27147_c0_g2_i1:198-533(-)
MFNYMTDLRFVAATESRSVTVTGHDLHALLFNWLDECLFLFAGGDLFVVKHVRIGEFKKTSDGLVLTASLAGERFDRGKHPQGTEVKAITYSAMQVVEAKDKCDVFVIVDI